MMRKTLLLILAACTLRSQFAHADDASVGRFERQLAAIMRWEILWNDAPKGFQSPTNGSASLAALMMSNSISYFRCCKSQ